MRHVSKVLNWDFKAWSSGNTQVFVVFFFISGGRTRGKEGIWVGLMGPRCCVFKFPAVCIVVFARLAFQTGFYTLARVRTTFGGIEGAGWRRRKVKKQKAREKRKGHGDRYLGGVFWRKGGLWPEGRAAVWNEG